MWNATFKSHLRRSYDVWLSEPSVHEFTKGGNLKAPSRSLLCQWVKSAWEALPTESVKKSFLSCAITTSTDGSDDHEIHCLKPGQPCEAGRQVLQQEMATMNEDHEDENSNVDPFADTEDEEEAENNELLVDNDEADEDDDEADIDSDSYDSDI